MYRTIRSVCGRDSRPAAVVRRYGLSGAALKRDLHLTRALGSTARAPANLAQSRSRGIRRRISDGAQWAGPRAACSRRRDSCAGPHRALWPPRRRTHHSDVSYETASRGIHMAGCESRMFYRRARGPRRACDRFGVLAGEIAQRIISRVNESRSRRSVCPIIRSRRRERTRGRISAPFPAFVDLHEGASTVFVHSCSGAARPACAAVVCLPASIAASAIVAFRSP